MKPPLVATTTSSRLHDAPVDRGGRARFLIARSLR
jgi:hypothetical protein